jgi:hypothetical protein
VLPGQTRTPSQIMGELLTGHPEAASLHAEASHCQALARSSAANASRAFAAEQAARLGYEELRHRLDPRCQRTFHFGAGLVILAVLGTGLGVLDVIELGGTKTLLPALAATAVWLTGAWLTALAGRERRRRLVLAAITVAVLLGLLLAALHGFGRESMMFGILVSAFILVLTVGAAALMSRMESAALIVARWRWHGARAAHQATVKLEQDDIEAATLATGTWLGLVRIRASAVAGDDERLVHETVALAIAVLESCRPQLPSLGPGDTMIASKAETQSG